MPDEPTAALPTTEWVIMDGVRNVAHAQVLYCVQNSIPCTVLVHPRDEKVADKRLPQSPLINRVSFDYLKPQAPLSLDTICTGARYLFLDPEDDNYATWHTTVLKMTETGIALAHKNALTIFYPARIYALKKSEVVPESAPYEPCTRQGTTAAEIELLLKNAADQRRCKVRKIRVGYIFGPAIYDYLMESTFKDMPKNGRLTWLCRSDGFMHQFTYTMDVAALACFLSREVIEPYECTVHFSGYTYYSVDAFGAVIAQVAGQPFQKRIHSKFQLFLAQFINANVERGQDLWPYFEAPALLEDSAFLNAVQFKPTPPEEAIASTLAWYKEHSR